MVVPFPCHQAWDAVNSKIVITYQNLNPVEPHGGDEGITIRRCRVCGGEQFLASSNPEDSNTSEGITGGASVSPGVNVTV